MRAFLILLILANAGYFAWWQGWFAPQSARPEVETQQTGFQQTEQALTLLNELPAARLQLMRSLAEARTIRSAAGQQLEQVQQQVESVQQELVTNQAELAEDQARSSAVQQALLESLDTAVAEASSEAPTPWCAATGIFADQAGAAGFAQGLVNLGLEAEIVVREEPISSTWWVHIPAETFASEAEARELLSELQARNIDSYYMRTGEMAGGISLGVYSREESAKIAQRQRADQGYTTSIRQVFRMEERPRVRLVMPDSRLRESPNWAAFLDSAGPVELTEFSCEAIASENQFP